jgi:predicted acyltransferase
MATMSAADAELPEITRPTDVRLGTAPRFEPNTRSTQRVFEPIPERLTSLDAYRGFVMLAMVSDALGLHQVAKAKLAEFKTDPYWTVIGFHSEHVLWEGCSFWDLIQPSFMFMVGVAVAFSSANRRANGQSYATMLLHAVGRAVFLILLGVFLRSNGQVGQSSGHTNWTFVDVVSQIGLGYIFLFLLWGQSFGTQLAVALAILVAYWCYFYFHPVPDPLVIPYLNELPGYEPLEGLRAAWNIHINSAADFDRWFLNLFPPYDYTHNRGGYQTLNFIPALATMIFGLMAGEWLRSDRSLQRRCLVLLIAGAVGLAIGYVLHITGVCPVIKKIWTPSWAIYSAGWASILLGVFFFLFDVINLKPVAWPLTAVGRNSLAVYVLNALMASWIIGTVAVHTSPYFFQWLAPLVQEPLRTQWLESPPASIFALFGTFEPVARKITVLIVIWAVAIWMYRRKLFLRV